MLSEKDDVVDRVTGLELGADDYVPKPFHLRELLARIRSLIRRSEIRGDGDVENGAASNEASLLFSGWRLDTRRRELRSPAGKPVELTAGEFNLLVAFVERANRVVSRDELFDIVYNREGGPEDRSVDVQIGRLRRKIEIDPRRPALIKTIRGLGYLFTAEIERS
jgi:DNA-binding response OmpR family regulator